MKGNATVTWSVCTDERLVAFTFDDGPVPNCTPLMLDALDAAEVRATLFLVGARLEQNVKLIEGRIDRHEVGNHTWSHKDLTTMPSFQATSDEISRGHDAIVDHLGREPRLFRPPFGHLSAYALRAADRYAYEVVLWSQGVTERLFQQDPESVVPYVVDNMVPGTIYLIHDAVAEGIEPVFLRRLGQVIAQLRDKGYEFVTVSELLARRSVHGEPGPT